MKRNILIASLLVASTSAFAEFVGTTQTQQGGFIGPTISKTTVEKAKTFKDDMPVVLEGNIIEIDHNDWRGVQVSPKDTVTINGEVDKDWMSIEIDVDSVKK